MTDKATQETGNDSAVAPSLLNVELGALLPCPHCGGSDLKIGHSAGGFCWVYCPPCHIRKHALTDADAATEWNTRAPNAKLSTGQRREEEL